MPAWLQVTLPIVAGIFLGLVAVIWRLLNSKIDREKDALWNQIGRSSQEGMRKTVHDMANMAQRIEGIDIRIRRFEDRENGRR